jgi:nicotinate dehydrogenase subunit B
MSPDDLDDLRIEPERYELFESSPYRFEVDRRDFLRVFSAMGGGLLVVAALPVSARQESGRGFARGPVSNGLASWLHIDEKGFVTGYTGKVEIGQNIRTSLAQTIGDELRVPLESIALVMADTDLTPFDQGTFGSRTTPTMAPVLARAAATAREMLIDRAAAAWNADRATLKAEAGTIVGAGGRSIRYGELTKGQKLTGVVAADAKETARTDWKMRGAAPRKVNGRDFVTGKHAYTPDVSRPNLLIGRLVRPPAIGATAKSVDDAQARAMPGVTVVRDANLIGVVAPTERLAARAAEAVRVEWNLPAGLPTSETIYEHLRPAARRGEPAAPSSGRVFEASYKIPYIAHVPLEPRAAVAEWSADGEKLTVWTGTQRPFGVRSELAQAFRIPEERVRVIVPDVGSAYGGKHTGDVAIEAARLARGAGRPIKIVYTRAEEFMWAYFRPAGVIDVKATVDAGGRITSWEFDNWNSGNAGLNTPYAIQSRREEFHNVDSPLRQGSYRGLAATANHHAREMHMDEIARALGVDAVAFRLKHIADLRLKASPHRSCQEIGLAESISGRTVARHRLWNRKGRLHRHGCRGVENS